MPRTGSDSIEDYLDRARKVTRNRARMPFTSESASSSSTISHTAGTHLATPHSTAQPLQPRIQTQQKQQPQQTQHQPEKSAASTTITARASKLLRNPLASFKDAVSNTKVSQNSSHGDASTRHQERLAESATASRNPMKRRLSMPFRPRVSSFGDLRPSPASPAESAHVKSFQHYPSRVMAHAPPVLSRDPDSGARARQAVRHLKGLDLPKQDLNRRDSNLSNCCADNDSVDRPVTIYSDGEDDKSRQVMRLDPVRYLPAELSDHIFSFLNAHSLRQCEQVSRGWHSTASDTVVWRDIFLNEYGGKKVTSKSSMVGGRGIGKSKVVQQDWKAMYHARKTLSRNWAEGKASAIYLHGHTDSVYCVQFDETKIITGSRDRTIRVWSTERPFRCLRVIGVPDAIHTDRKEQGTTHRLDIPSDHSVAPERAPLQTIDPAIYHVPTYYHNASILCLQYDDEIAVTGSSDCSLIVWDIKTWQPLRRLCKHTAGVLDIALDKEKIVSCSKDSNICIWDRKTGELLDYMTGHNGPVNAVQLRGNLFVSASGEGSAKLWNVQVNNAGTDDASATTTLVHEFWSEERGLACVEFSEDARYIFAGGNDQVIYKFDTATGAVAGRMKGHTALVRSLYLDAASGRIVSGSYDLGLRVWDYKTGKQLLHFPGWATSWMLSAKADYRRIVSTSQDGRVCVVDFARDDDNEYPGVDWRILKSEEELKGPVEQTVSTFGSFVIPERKSFPTIGSRAGRQQASRRTEM